MILKLLALLFVAAITAFTTYSRAYDNNLSAEELKKYKMRSSIIVTSVVLVVSGMMYGAMMYFEKATRPRLVSRQELSRTLSA